MFAGEDTAGAGKTDENKHKNLESDADGLTLDVVGEDKGNKEEDGGDDHDMAGRE